jgi:uncharacterized protein
MGTSAAALAVVTGASSGIGIELARELVADGFDVLVVAEGAAIERAAAELGERASALRADLATAEGVDELVAFVESKGIPDAVAVNAGIGVNGAFVETALADHLRLLALNITGAVQLTHRLLPAMVARGSGRWLFTSSIAAMMPSPYLSTYAASKSFLYSFAEALRNELSDHGLTVTALMPGPTHTEFFERADMEDTKLGRADKDDPADVARQAVDAMLAGKDHVVTGAARNHLQALTGKLLPGKAIAGVGAKMAKPDHSN